MRCRVPMTAIDRFGWLLLASDLESFVGVFSKLIGKGPEGQLGKLKTQKEVRGMLIVRPTLTFIYECFEEGCDFLSSCLTVVASKKKTPC